MDKRASGVWINDGVKLVIHCHSCGKVSSSYRWKRRRCLKCKRPVDDEHVVMQVITLKPQGVPKEPSERYSLNIRPWKVPKDLEPLVADDPMRIDR